ncbi:hypothetical protein [Serinicoccus kebangsaanensis]|uniref:hypothetical protein n=1 Tax=Serinicoccus kebangsaanensis TaxID=2602069 RepID=UPI00178C2FD4|nr:hypothetical protein [Serinicoccus kebangsaanensis]
MPSRADRLPQVSWVGVLVGAVAVLIINTATSLFVAPFFASALIYLDSIVVLGALSVLSSLFRAMAGIFAGRAFRARRVVTERTNYLLTGLLAGALGWLLWSGLVLALGDAQMFTSARGWIELPRWMAEVALGTLLVSVDPPAPLRFRTRSLVGQR